jgi:hypothetical protein
MDLSELRDLLDFLESQGVDEQTLREVFQRYCPTAAQDSLNSEPATPSDASDPEEVLVHKSKVR